MYGFENVDRPITAICESHKYEQNAFEKSGKRSQISVRTLINHHKTSSM